MINCYMCLVLIVCMCLRALLLNPFCCLEIDDRIVNRLMLEMVMVVVMLDGVMLDGVSMDGLLLEGVMMEAVMLKTVLWRL